MLSTITNFFSGLGWGAGATNSPPAQPGVTSPQDPGPTSPTTTTADEEAPRLTHKTAPSPKKRNKKALSRIQSRNRKKEQRARLARRRNRR